MGSVINYKECPNCKEEAFSEFYYKTGEEFTGCSSCGYSHTIRLKNRSGDISEDNIVVKEIAKPYGAYRYKTFGHVGAVWGSLATSDNATQFILTHKDNPNTEYAYISRYLNGEFIREEIINQGPEITTK